MSLHDIGAAVNTLDLSVAFLNEYVETERATTDTGQSEVQLAGNTTLRNAMGAFYTPVDIASYLLRQLNLTDADTILEPSFGDGSFLRAMQENGLEASTACDIDAAACDHALAKGYLNPNSLFKGSFFDLPNNRRYQAVVGNPPYVRLRALPKSESSQLISLSADYLSAPIGEESSEWLPFLLKAVNHLFPGGSIAFVLPLDFTYVRYARSTWSYLGNSFGSITVSRVHERIFSNLMQDVVLFVATEKGGGTDTVFYRCYEMKDDLFAGRTCIEAEIRIDQIVSGNRPFLHAFVPKELHDLLARSPRLVRCSTEAELHIGYVCGNKRFFHPPTDVQRQFRLPDEHLIPSIVSSRQLAGSGVRTSEMRPDQRLWLPSNGLTDGEEDYVRFGEEKGVQLGYKCRVRNPWWKVPGVSSPDLAMSVFGEAPRMTINDGGWAVSNSLLGVTLRKSVEPELFCASWYSSITRLSVELEVHSLGGGVLVAVPRESGRIVKLQSSLGDSEKLDAIDNQLKANDIQAAYQVNDGLIANTFGKETADAVWQTIELLKSWRKR